MNLKKEMIPLNPQFGFTAMERSEISKKVQKAVRIDSEFETVMFKEELNVTVWKFSDKVYINIALWTRGHTHTFLMMLGSTCHRSRIKEGGIPENVVLKIFQ